jgi:hypothetical protein
MMTEAYSSVGTLSDEKTVILDEPIHLPPGRVHVIVEPLPEGESVYDWLDKLQAIRQRLRESGHRPRTREQVDKQIQSERESWDC